MKKWILFLLLLPVIGLGQSVDGGLKTLVASGTNTYAVTEPLPLAYDPHERFLIRFTNANTGASTLNRSGLGAQSILWNDGSSLAANDILAGETKLLSYNGSNYYIVGSKKNVSTGSSILYGNGSGGFSNVTIGSNLTFSGGTLSVSGGNITNSASANELGMSDGTNITHSGLFQGSNLGDLYLGVSGSPGTTGNNRTISAHGNGGGQVNITLYPQSSSGQVIVDNSGSQGALRVGSGSQYSLIGINSFGNFKSAGGQPLLIKASAGISGSTTGEDIQLLGGPGYASGTTNAGNAIIASGIPNSGGTEGSVYIQNRLTGNVSIFRNVNSYLASSNGVISIGAATTNPAHYPTFNAFLRVLANNR